MKRTMAFAWTTLGADFFGALRRVAFSLGLVTLIGLPVAVAGGGGGGCGQPPAIGSGDDISSLPSVVGGSGPRVTLIGPIEEIRGALKGVRGSGIARLEPLGTTGEFALSFRGHVAVHLDRKALSGTEVRLLVEGSGVELPLSGLAQARQRTQSWRLSNRGNRSSGISLHGDVLTVVQGVAVR